ncbi:MAG: adenine deaminase [Chitinophagales bacterium]|nr:adenine deaminase [Chitinophagales bacterium]
MINQLNSLQGQVVDLHEKRIYPAEVGWQDGKIQYIKELVSAPEQYILPGFIDAHVHIESSMLVPSEFARLCVPHGTVATISDPHEIANVLGEKGVEFMIENGQRVPFHFYFGAPSCVPATAFETAGANIGPEGIKRLMSRPEIRYLAEMMNYPGVLNQDPEVMEKIKIAQSFGKPIDGHAPGLKGEAARKYMEAGISTDHECFTYEEGLNKLQLGMKVIIREGSAARNYEALIPLIKQYPDQIMFCSDDKHPDSLLEGHINQVVARGLREGYDLFDLLRAACLHPVTHYGLDVGLLRSGDAADFIVVQNLNTFEHPTTYIKGQKVAEGGKSLIAPQKIDCINKFHAQPISKEALAIPAKAEQIRIIKAEDGELITGQFITEALIIEDKAVSDPGRDILKLVVLNRYTSSPPAFAFINGFTIQKGALASCVGHDSHNIIAVGTDDKSICRAINLIIEHKGGVSAVQNEIEKIVPLPVAGIMSDQDGYEVAEAYKNIDAFAKNDLGSSLRAPFMTLSFMALLVIPELKLSDKGLFDGKNFQFASLFLE